MILGVAFLAFVAIWLGVAVVLVGLVNLYLAFNPTNRQEQ
jgi:hypothetical protein